MIQVTFEYPLPNEQGRYDLSEEELRELLEKAYQKGISMGIQSHLPIVTDTRPFCTKCGNRDIYTTIDVTNRHSIYHCSCCGMHWEV